MNVICATCKKNLGVDKGCKELSFCSRKCAERYIEKISTH